MGYVKLKTGGKSVCPKPCHDSGPLILSFTRDTLKYRFQFLNVFLIKKSTVIYSVLFYISATTTNVSAIKVTGKIL
jgi:hypothetical protein